MASCSPERIRYVFPISKNEKNPKINERRNQWISKQINSLTETNALDHYKNSPEFNDTQNRKNSLLYAFERVRARAHILI